MKREEVFVLPEYQDQKGKFGIVFMRKLGGIRSEAPKQVRLFESTDPKWNAHSNFRDVWWHKDRKTAIVFADSHARAFSHDDPSVPAAETGLTP